MRRIADAIESRLERPPSLADLAVLCGLSPRHLMRAFKQGTGQTIMEYVEAIRLRLALRLLSDTDLPLDEVEAATGSKVLYLQGEVEVSAAGPVSIKVNDPGGLTAWVDSKPAAPLAGTSIPADLSPGRHTITFRVDTT